MMHRWEMASSSRDKPLSWSVEALSVEHKHSTIQRLPDASPTSDGTHLFTPSMSTDDARRPIRHHRITQSRMPKQTMNRCKQEWGTKLTMQPMLPPVSPSYLDDTRLLAVMGNITPKPHPPSTQLGTAQGSPACPPWDAQSVVIPHTPHRRQAPTSPVSIPSRVHLQRSF